MKEKIGIFLAIALACIFGAGIGWLMADYADYNAEINRTGASVGETLFQAAKPLIIAYVWIGVQTIIHEAGHLVFGLLTGYHFSSFRIGSFMWVKREGRIRFARYSLAGTGGQCLLAPPDMQDGRFPYVLYHMGGSLMNLLSAVLAGGIAALCHSMGAETAGKSFVIAAAIGAVYALINGIPMRLGTIDNDGYNA